MTMEPSAKKMEVKDKKKTYIYMSYSGKFPPQEADWQTTPKLGDLYTKAEGDNIWIYRDGEWVLADKADDDKGNPVERFPSDKGRISWIMLANGKWTNRRDVTRKKNARKTVETNQEDNEASPPGGPSSQAPETGGSLNNQQGPVEESSNSGQLESPQASVGPTEGSSPKAYHLANSWLEPLYTEWKSGPSGLSHVQVSRGLEILSDLLGWKTPVRRLTPEDHEGSTTCRIVGHATRRVPHIPPSDTLAIRDLIHAGKNSLFMDSITNQLDPDVDAADYLALSKQFALNLPLKHGSKLYSALDVPLSKQGFQSCGYGFPPFEDEQSIIASSGAHALTLPGAITYPHMDGFACTFYTVHWAGVKFWAMWPATEANLKKMEGAMVCQPDISGARHLFATLEGLEVIHITNDPEYAEFAFYLLPSTIHACLSFTECGHIGVPLRSSQLISHFTHIMKWGGDWIGNRLMVAQRVDKEEKISWLKEYGVAIDKWSEVAAKMGRGAQKKELTDALKLAKETFNRFKYLL